MSGRGDSDEALGRVPLALTLQPGTNTIADQVSELVGERTFVGSLLVIGGAQADIGTHILVEAEVVIGREPTGLQLRDGRCSRRHARVFPQGDSYSVADMGSTNGTLLNGAPVEGEQPLADGDRIRLGQTTLKFTLVDGTEAAYLRRMEQLASRDALTGLLANHRFASLLAEAHRTALALGTPLAVLMMDMDGLKAINDAHGHRMGAQTIRQVGAIIGEICRGQGEATRFGGDEFSAFMPGYGEQAAVALAERIRSRVEATAYALDDIRVHASISIGVAVLSPSTPTWTALQEAADKALYRAKEAGRNRVAT
ncbi:MAG: two-component system cell cycle response regulator [Myxococcota bacterium]|jgi:two-component system cell cycle response regulator